jgi:hypothetical protein
MKEPRVKQIIKNYKEGNIEKVYEYLSQSDMIVDPSTWSGQIKKMIENKQFITAKQTIELIAYKLIKIKNNGTN